MQEAYCLKVTTITIRLREYIARGCDFSRMLATEVATPKVLSLMALKGITCSLESEGFASASVRD